MTKRCAAPGDKGIDQRKAKLEKAGPLRESWFWRRRF
jgi:hypothetical protein